MSQRSIRFPDGLEAAAEKMAAEHERSFSWIVVKALESFVPGAYLKATAKRPAVVDTPERVSQRANEDEAVRRLSKPVPGVRRAREFVLDPRQAALNKAKKT